MTGRMMRSACLFLIVAGVLTGGAGAQNPTAEIPASAIVSTAQEREGSAATARDFLVVAGGADTSGGATGRNVSLDWIRVLEKQDAFFSGGFSSFWAPASHWSFGKGSAAFRPADKFILEGQARIGAGHTGNTSFPYRVFNGTLTYQSFSRLHLRFGTEQIRIAETHGNIVKPGVTLLVSRLVAADMTYAGSVSGNVGTAYLAGRIDVAAQPAGFFGGVAAGHTTPEVFDLHVGMPPTQQSLWEGYFGVRLEVWRAEWNVVSDFTSVGETRKRAVTLSVKVPLKFAGGGNGR